MVRAFNWIFGLACVLLLSANTVSILPGEMLGTLQAYLPKRAENAWRVSSSIELQLALLSARPGQSIELADGVYRGFFVIGVSGTEEKPITLLGGSNTIIDSGSTSMNYGLFVRADHWRIKNITVRNAKKGIVLENASHNVLSALRVQDIGEEAVRMRGNSVSNVLQDSTIMRTGRLRPGYGEGVYIGTSWDKWDAELAGSPDRSDFNQVLNCNFGPDITAEHIDIKEGTTGGIVRSNVMNGAGISGENYADSFLDVKGNSYVIEDNVGFVTGPTTIVDGIQVHDKLGVWGKRNVFRNNSMQLDARGYGINVKDPAGKTVAGGNTVEDNNEISGASLGYSNVAPRRSRSRNQVTTSSDRQP